MTPKEPTGGRATGTSFKGAFLYYTHDKRAEGEKMSLSSDRVDWMEFRNLATDDPHLASSIMAATAANQSALKQAAGKPLPKRGESDQVVYHYSLGWHPDEAEKLTKPEMLRAANESIRALGAEHCQAAVIAHNDTAHPHVHVVINRVNPETGEMLNLWQSQKKLSRWALAYEQERGQIYCDKRQENWNARTQGNTVRADKDAPYHLHDQVKTPGHSNDNNFQQFKAEQKSRDADLSAYGKAMHNRHSQEWKNLSANYQAGKEKIKGRLRNGKTPYQQAAADVRAQFKPLWSSLGKTQWAEFKDFEKREKRLAGKIENAFAAVRHATALGREDSKGFMSSAFNFLISSKARADALEKLHAAQKRGLSAAQSAEVKAAIRTVRNDQQAALKAHRTNFNNDRDALKDKQATEREDLKRKWQNRKVERSRAYEIFKRGDKVEKEAKAKPESRRGEARAEFNKAVKQKRKRSRSRSRKME